MITPFDFKRFLQLGLWLTLLGGVLSTAPASAQPAVRGSIAKSTIAPLTPMTRVVVLGRPNLDLNNVLFENINICISIPDQGPDNPNPKAFIFRNFVPSLEWTVAGGNPDLFDGRAYYTFIGNDTGSMRVNWLAMADNPIVELSFKEGVGWDYVQLNDRSEGGIGAGGGPGRQSFWYVQANTLGDITNYGSKFYESTSSKLPMNGGILTPSAVETADTVALPVKPSPQNTVWQLFPNPVPGPLHLLPGSSGPALLQIFDRTGRLMWEQKTLLYPAEVIDIPATGSLVAGAYWLEVRSLDGRRLYGGRFIVLRE